jgi:predicted RNA-binding Zn-ribbon protein involved in translation (DUF1610 family)
MNLGPTTGSQQGGNVAASILQGTCRAVTDGSYKDHHSTAAFIIQGTDWRQSIKGDNTTPGSPAEQCAYRSELGGIVGILVMLELLCSQFYLTSGQVTLGCDCESAIKKLRAHKHPKPSDSHYDLLMDCRARIRALPITVTFKWVEGHQDSKHKGHSLALDWWARQNIAMDNRAKAHWHRTKHHTPPNIVFQHEPYAVLLDGVKLSSFHKGRVHASTGQGPIRHYWQTKHKLSDTQFQDINWQATQTAQRAQPMGRRRWQAKFMTSHCSTGKMMLIRKKWSHSRCPRCGEAVEDTRHLCRCPDPAATTCRQKAFHKLNKWLAGNHTMPQIQHHLLLLLRRWIANEPPPQAGTTRTGRALQAQSDLGGWNTIMGRISKQLTQAQTAYYGRLKSLRSGQRWTVQLIHLLQDFSFHMWDHRNKVKANDPSRHFTREDDEEMARDIAKEWITGARGLLRQDRFLFRCRAGLETRTLPQQREWLTSVANARMAAAADAANKHTFEDERQGMQDFLRRPRHHHTTQTLTARDGPQTTKKSKDTKTHKQQKPLENNKKITAYLTTQKRQPKEATNKSQRPAKKPKHS